MIPLTGTSIHKDKPAADLWIAFTGGDKVAFSILYKKCYSKLYSYGINLGMDESQASDAIQDIFLKLYERPHIITETSTLLPFLFRSVRNYFINIQKKKKSYVDIKDYVNSFTFEYTIEEQLIVEEDKKTLSSQIEDMLSCLTSRQKEIIYFRFLHEMDYEEISVIMNISQQSARNTLYKAFEKIRKKYPQYLPLFIWVLKNM